MHANVNALHKENQSVESAGGNFNNWLKLKFFSLELLPETTLEREQTS